MKNSNIKKIFATILEPIAFGLLALLFIIPSITVVNLEPLTKKLKDLDVLGVSEKAELEIEIVGGSHQIFSREKIKEDEEGIFSYTTTITRRDSDRYSKPILVIKNNRNQETTIEVYGHTDLPTKSDISLIIDDQVYRLESPSGDVTSHKILLTPNGEYTVYLAIESFSDVQFNEDFELEIKELE